MGRSYGAIRQMFASICYRQVIPTGFALVCPMKYRTRLHVLLISGTGNDFNDSVLTTAPLDRILHRCEVIKLSGDSYRMKNRKTIFENNKKEI